MSREGALELVPIVAQGEPVGVTPVESLSRRRLEGSYGPVNKLTVATVNHREDGDSEPYVISTEPESAVGWLPGAAVIV